MGAAHQSLLGHAWLHQGSKCLSLQLSGCNAAKRDGSAAVSDRRIGCPALPWRARFSAYAAVRQVSCMYVLTVLVAEHCLRLRFCTYSAISKRTCCRRFTWAADKSFCRGVMENWMTQCFCLSLPSTVPGASQVLSANFKNLIHDLMPSDFASQQAEWHGGAQRHQDKHLLLPGLHHG